MILEICLPITLSILTKLEGGCLIYLRKSTLDIWQSLYQHHFHINTVLIDDSYLVIKVGLVFGEALVIILQFLLTRAGHPPRYSN